MDSITFQIPSMTEVDSELVQTELQQIPGVRLVQVYFPTRSVTVTWTSPASVESFAKHLEALHLTADFPQDF